MFAICKINGMFSGLEEHAHNGLRRASSNILNNSCTPVDISAHTAVFMVHPVFITECRIFSQRIDAGIDL